MVISLFFTLQIIYNQLGTTNQYLLNIFAMKIICGGTIFNHTSLCLPTKDIAKQYKFKHTI